MNTHTTDSAPAGPAELATGQAMAQVVVALIEHCTRDRDGPEVVLLDAVAAAATGAGLRAHRERALLGGGTADLLVSPAVSARAGEAGTGQAGIGGAGVGGAETGAAVVVAGHGATDALRGRLRRLGAHREVTVIVLVTTRDRHRMLEQEVREVPVHVVVIGPGEEGPPAGVTAPEDLSRRADSEHL